MAVAAATALALTLSVGSASADVSTSFTVAQLCATSQSYVVPNGITKLQVTAVGQAGVGGDSEPLATHGGGVGGAGEKVVATIPVTSGETLYPEGISGGLSDFAGIGEPVPGGPGSGGHGVGVTRDGIGNCNGIADGGGGGGSGQPLVVAGGGGGGGWGDVTGPGGTGGSAGATVGGAGNPGDDNGATAGAGGNGGTQSAGGSGGAAGYAIFSGWDGENGLYWEGGGGGLSAFFGFSSGGGGGGGYYGGGGGGGSAGAGGGGGGGGSSYVTSSATGVSESTSSDAAGVTFRPIGPANTSPPVISGYPYRSKTLTSSTGTWTGTGTISYAYQWRDCTGVDGSGYGTGCTDISGATNSSYLVQASDVGRRLESVVTATDSTGSNSWSSLATDVVGQYSQVIQGDGPTAYWRLGDAFDQSAMSDSSGNGHDGTYKNGASGTAGLPQPVYGISGDGDTTAIFTGNGTYGYVNGISAPQGAYTIELWVKPSDLNPAMLFQQGGAGAIWINGSGQLAFRQVDNFADSEIDYSLPAGFDPTVFHQVVGTWDGHTAVLYLDGTSVGQKTVADPVSGASTVYLGYGTFAPWLRGYLDEAAYYGHALSATQVTTHFHADPPLNLPGKKVAGGGGSSGSGSGAASGSGGSHAGGSTKAQKLKRALAKCRRIKNRQARARCVAAAHKRYGRRS